MATDKPRDTKRRPPAQTGRSSSGSVSRSTGTDPSGYAAYESSSDQGCSQPDTSNSYTGSVDAGC